MRTVFLAVLLYLAFPIHAHAQATTSSLCPTPKTAISHDAYVEIGGIEQWIRDYSYIQFVGMKGDGMLSQVDLRTLGPQFEVPVYLLQGEQDLVKTPEVAKRWYEGIKAPHKEFIVLPKTGHDPNQTVLDAQYGVLLKVRKGMRRD